MTTLTTNYLTPTGREEAWRFTPLKRLKGLHESTTILADHPSLSASTLAEGVTLSLEAAADVPASSTTDDVVVQHLRESVQSVTVLSIAKDAVIAEPIILSRNSLGDVAEASRTVIRAGLHSQATVVVENVGSATLAEEIEIILEPGASLRFITLQEWSNDAVHLGRHHAIIGKDASFTSVVVTVGGSLVRLLPTVEFAGPGASADMYGLYFAGDGQHLEHRIHVDHNVGYAKSRVNYKGALSGDGARTVWIGDVFIRAAADGTDTYELNRNLLLSDGARADSVPNLEIETGDIVGAGHASTTGRFDDEQLFYLESRGIPESEAKRLVIRGFFLEILSKIAIESIEERIMERIDADLSKVEIA
jgi:Fe-S cluster assembly protein SufD